MLVMQTENRQAQEERKGKLKWLRKMAILLGNNIFFNLYSQCRKIAPEYIYID